MIDWFAHRGMKFVWPHKVALRVSDALIAFLDELKPFLCLRHRPDCRGGRGPVRRGGAPSVAQEATRRTSWTELGIVAVLALGVGCAVRPSRGRSPLALLALRRRGWAWDQPPIQGQTDHPDYTVSALDTRFWLAGVPPVAYEAVARMSNWNVVRRDCDPEYGQIFRLVFGPLPSRLPEPSSSRGRPKRSA